MNKQQFAGQSPPSPVPGDPDRGDTSTSAIVSRYGAPKRKVTRRTKIILVASTLVAAMTGAGYLAAGNTPPVTSKNVGFVIEDATYATVTFNVTKDPQATAKCAVQVLSKNFAVVGWKVVTIGPNGSTHEQAATERSTVHRTELRTESQGVSGGVESCWIANPGN